MSTTKCKINIVDGDNFHGYMPSIATINEGLLAEVCGVARNNQFARRQIGGLAADYLHRCNLEDLYNNADSTEGGAGRWAELHLAKRQVLPLLSAVSLGAPRLLERTSGAPSEGHHVRDLALPRNLPVGEVYVAFLAERYVNTGIKPPQVFHTE